MHNEASFKDENNMNQKEIFVHPMNILKRQNFVSSIKQSNKQTNQQVQLKINQNKEQINQEQVHNPFETDQGQNASSLVNKQKKITKKLSSSLSKSQSKVLNYRTRMCPDGIQCRKRLVCTFAHNQYQLRRPYKNRKNPCIRYQKGLCSQGAACPDYHGNMDLKKKNYKYKNQKCKQYFEGGSCSKGKLCIFIHDQTYSQQSLNSQSQINEEQQNKKEFIQNQANMKDLIMEQQRKADVHEDNKEKNSLNSDTHPLLTTTKQQKIKIGDIFSQNSNCIKVKQVVEQKIEQSIKQTGQKQQIDQGFNIEFNF